LGVPCHIEIEGVPFEPRAPRVFAKLPRIGETVALEWNGDQFPIYTVYDVRHVPDGVEEKPAFTVLFVR
jgi:hypothetical protein